MHARAQKDGRICPARSGLCARVLATIVDDDGRKLSFQRSPEQDGHPFCLVWD
jgi:hypothetical protein